MIYHLVDPFIGWVLRWGCPQDDKHPQWLCKLFDDYLDRWDATHLDEPFFTAQAAGIGIGRRFFASPIDVDMVLRWIDDEIQRTPIYPGLDAFRILLFQAEGSAEAEFSESTQLIEWTGFRVQWSEQRDSFQYTLETAVSGCYAVVNAAGNTLRYTLPYSSHNATTVTNEAGTAINAHHNTRSEEQL